MLTKIDQSPVLKKIRQANPYITDSDSGQIYGHYVVSIRWADGTRKLFNSEEEANAFLERRPVNQDNIQKEIPLGYYEAVNRLITHKRVDNETPELAKEVSVMLMGYGESKVSVIKKIREITGLGLKESKAFVENVPARVGEPMEMEQAQELKLQLEEAGATINIK